MRRLFDTEPAVVLGVVTAAVAALTSFGVAISTGQSNALYGLVASALALGQAFVTRSQVSPAGGDA